MGDIQKKLGSDFRRYKGNAKGKLSHGGTVGRLTDIVIDNFQNYYDAAIRSNKNAVMK